MKIEENKVTVGQIIEGLNRMIREHDITPEAAVEWAESIDTEKQVMISARNGEFHPLGTILLHIIPVGEDAGTASFEPRRSSKYFN